VAGAKLPLTKGGKAIKGLRKTLELLPPDGTPFRQKDLKKAAAASGMAWSTASRHLETAERLLLVLVRRGVDRRGQPEVIYRLATPDVLPIGVEDRKNLQEIQSLAKLARSATPPIARSLVTAHLVNELVLLRLFELRALSNAASMNSDHDAHDRLETMLQSFLRLHLSNMVDVLRSRPDEAIGILDEVILETVRNDLSILGVSIHDALDAIATLPTEMISGEKARLESIMAQIQGLRKSLHRPPIYRAVSEFEATGEGQGAP
jgi:DNA-binding transcriptional ArsR family regulator